MSWEISEILAHQKLLKSVDYSPELFKKNTANNVSIMKQNAQDKISFIEI